MEAFTSRTDMFSAAAMEGAPLTDVVHVPLTFEVVGVLGALESVSAFIAKGGR